MKMNKNHIKITTITKNLDLIFPCRMYPIPHIIQTINNNQSYQTPKISNNYDKYYNKASAKIILSKLIMQLINILKMLRKEN